ncbi:MAG: Lrp/AsnC family transcriptional regulator [Xanthomonadaceae bacterium]|nr:Lrp/AsnC family transcriptional regulator [Xanthomonadaceae bacterium]
MGLILTDRDRKILKLCQEQGFITLNIIHEYLFQKSSSRRARERIQELEKSGYLKSRASLELQNRKVVQLTIKGKAIVQTLPGYKPERNFKIHDLCLSHDDKLTWVRLRLEGLWSGDWLSDRMMKHVKDATPDGIIEFASRKRVYVELENSIKSEIRYSNIFSKYQLEDPFLVLYVCTRPEIKKYLINYCIKHTPQLPLAILTMSELKEEQPRAWTIKGLISPFTKREY